MDHPIARLLEIYLDNLADFLVVFNYQYFVSWRKKCPCGYEMP